MYETRSEINICAKSTRRESERTFANRPSGRDLAWNSKTDLSMCFVWSVSTITQPWCQFDQLIRDHFFAECLFKIYVGSSNMLEIEFMGEDHNINIATWACGAFRVRTKKVGSVESY